jgi:hypothetical protein
LATRASLKYLGATLASLLLLHFAYGLAHRLYNAPSKGDLTFASGFESGDASLWAEKGAIQVCCDDSLEIVEAPVRSGRYAARFTLRRSDPSVKGSKRAELRTKAGWMGAEYWYAFSIFLPPDWTVDQVPVTLAQWHSVPDVWFGEAGVPPPFKLIAQEGQWLLANMWDSKRVSRTRFTEHAPEGGTLVPIGPLDTGRWTDWVFHIKWSSGPDGLLEAWKTERLVFHQKGPNTYNDAFAPYFKLGIYVPQWANQPSLTSIDSHTIHFDEIRVTEAPSTLLEMSPKP